MTNGGKINRVEGLPDCTFCRSQTGSSDFSGQNGAGMTVAQLTAQSLIDLFRGMKPLGLTPSALAALNVPAFVLC